MVETADGAITLPVERERPFDPPGLLAECRRVAPLCRLRYPDGHLGWLITGYELMRQVLIDPRFSSRSELTRVPVRREGAGPFIGQPAQPGWFVDMDPPEHTRFRRLLSGYFSSSRIAGMRDRVTDIVDRCIADLRRLEPPADLVQSFAVPIPALVIGDLLGVPEPARADFLRNSATLFSLDVTAEQAMSAMAELNELLLGLVRQRRRDRAGDLLSALIRSDLSDIELAGTGVLLLTAGHDSIANMLGLGTFALLCQPDQLALLRSGRCSMDNAVEELVRYLTVFQFGLPRTALVDVELAGRLIRAGECVTLSLPSANRDPTRSTKGHLAFGHGIHKCIGMHLARLEMQVAFAALFTAFPKLELAVAADAIEMSINSGRYGVRALPVTW
jgi:cytochrome P450